ncbi:hypothetical protein CI109_102261 [Kwoniella shandongensis]|uniref:Uncharacterized protein n=1 Tax=Kwoniella shandongensis TaxID=1734106 RepID=A0A5M6C1V8_9TREE|nr:uncharacterized protein CI109_003585 [Kwoniella shandongensis]KAA5527932.1 hypothetical protein CI109_003585 [Kwoniella shandongensis]
MSTIITPTHGSSSSSFERKRKYVLAVEIPVRRSRSRFVRSEAPSPPLSDSSTSSTFSSTTTVRPVQKVRIPLSTSSATLPSFHLNDNNKGKAVESTTFHSPSTTSSESWREQSVLNSDNEGPSTRIRLDVGSDVNDNVNDHESHLPAEAVECAQHHDDAHDHAHAHDHPMHIANLDILATAANFIADDDAAMEVLADGRIIPVESDSTVRVQVQVKEEKEVVPAKLMEVAKQVDDHWEEEDIVDAALAPHVNTTSTPSGDFDHAGEPSECLVCTESITDLLKGAEEEGKGGLGGGLALWVCELPNCGALYCLSCAIELVNRDYQRYKHPSCCACTRRWDVDALRKQAQTYDPVAMANPIIVPPPLNTLSALLSAQVSAVALLLARFRMTEQARGVGPDNAAPFIAWHDEQRLPNVLDHGLLQRAWQSYFLNQPAGMMNPRLDLQIILGHEGLAAEAVAEGIRGINSDPQGTVLLQRIAQIIATIPRDTEDPEERERRQTINGQVRMVAIRHSIKMRMTAVASFHDGQPRLRRGRRTRLPANPTIDDLIRRLGEVVPDHTLVNLGLIFYNRPDMVVRRPIPGGPPQLPAHARVVPDQIRQAVVAAFERQRQRQQRQAVAVAAAAGVPPNAPRLANAQPLPPQPAVAVHRPQAEGQAGRRPGREAGRRALERMRVMVADMEREVDIVLREDEAEQVV